MILRPGDGSIEVNKRTLEKYFPRAAPAVGRAAGARRRAATRGASTSAFGSTAAAYRGRRAPFVTAIARALMRVDPALRPELKRRGLLTRDARVKERRKAGLKKARKRPQFSKR